MWAPHPSAILIVRVRREKNGQCNDSCNLAILAAPAMYKSIVSEVARDHAGLHAAQQRLCVICYVHI